MANGSLISYRNQVWNAELTEMASTGDWQDNAPLANLLTPQLGEVGRFVGNSIEGICVFRIEFDEDQTIQLIGMMNAIFFGVERVGIEMRDALGDPIISITDLAVISYSDKEDYVPVNFWHIFETPQAGVRSIEISIFGEELLVLNLTIGGLWAGPAWTVNGLNPQYTIEVIDPSTIATTDANQTRAQRLKRYRQLSISIADLTRRTGLGIIDTGTGSDKVSNENSMIDLMLFSGNSSPIVAMPVTETLQDMHTLGVYGYLQGRLSLAGNTTSGEATKKLNSTQLVVKESL